MDTIETDNKLDLVDTSGKSFFVDTKRPFHLEESKEPQNEHKSESKPVSVDKTDENFFIDTEGQFQLKDSNEPQNEHESESKPVSVDYTDENFFIDTEGQFQLKDSNENELDSENKIANSVNNTNRSFDINEKEQFRFEKSNEPRNVLNICYSDTDSVDSDSDSSSTSTGNLSSETSSDSEDDSSDSDDSSPVKTKEKKTKTKTDYSLTDLPPIEELRISVPEDACIEIGTVTNIVDTLVIVESYKGTPALDVDSVLFLDCGKRTLGKVFDILGPVSEPVYAVRFNNQKQIKDFQVEKGLKVYCAPKTEHTSFVFLSEILKHKGSDASWKDNIEAPSEFQDFSDDEEERRHKMSINSNGGEDGSRKRPLNKSSNIVQPARFRPTYTQPRPNRFPNNQYRPFTRPNPHQVPMQPFHYNVPLNPGNPVLTGGPFAPPMYFPSRFPPPFFPTYGFPGQRIQQPFHQQRTHPYPEGWRPQYVFVPPPPPPPPPAPLPTESESGQNPARQS